MLYKVSEDFILRNWSIETLVKKVRHGAHLSSMMQGAHLGRVFGSFATGNDEAPHIWGEELSEEETIKFYRN